MSDFFTLMKPELVVTCIIFVLLLIKLGRGVDNGLLLPIIQNLLLLNLVIGFFFNAEGSLFDGVYQTTRLILFEKGLLNFALYLISLMFAGWMLETEHLSEFFVLMLSSLLGLDFLISSGNFLMFFISLELATIPLAAMANFDLDKRMSSEAAMKMILSSAFSSGILLFGISLLYGATGTLSFSGLPALLDGSSLQVLAFVFLVTAFAFKLSIVPFHLWTADVYEGSPIAATAFLSVVSKGAIAFVFIAALYKIFQPMQETWYGVVALLAVVTMITGNLFAVRQQNIKRFLAFSSIAQVGFILVGITAGTPEGTSAVVYFILVYTLSNLAAFGVAAAVASQTGKERIEDLKGMYATNPTLSWLLALSLFSLAGIPPTAGFFGKLFLITAGASKGNYGFILIAALNMIVSLFYYLRVIRAVFMDKNEQPLEKIHLHPSTKFALFICATGIVLLGVLSWTYDYIQSLN